MTTRRKPTKEQTMAVLTRGVTQVVPGVDRLAELMLQRPIKLYLGIDPTGSELTLGHSVVLRKLQQFAELGHQVILLIGNGTVRIGDPTGKDSTRPPLTDEQIKENFKNWEAQASKVLDFSKIEVVYNGDWLDKLTYTDMVKLMAQTTVQQLIERDMFQERMAKGLPIHGHEIIYPLLQGYDSVAMDVDLEIGGNDQLFNMLMGRHLQQVYNKHEKWVLTTPIINGTDGRKMSKSYGNYVSLTEKPVDMYGKLMRISDEEILTYFTVLTDVALTDIEGMRAAMKGGTNPIEFKKRLAHTIVQQLHSAEEANKVAAHFAQTVQGKEAPSEMPEITVTKSSLPMPELLRLCLPDESKSNLRRLVEQGGVENVTNGEKMNEWNTMVVVIDQMVLRIGKRNYFKIKLA